MNIIKFLFFAKSRNIFSNLNKKINNKLLFFSAKVSVIVITALAFISCGGAGGSSTSAVAPDLNVTLNATNDSGTIKFQATITNNSSATVDIALIQLHRNEVIIATSDQKIKLASNQFFIFSTTDTPSEPNNYSYKFCVQDDVISNNNFCSNESSFALFPELSISLSPNTEIVSAHTNFYLTTAVTNSGNKLSPSTQIDIFRSLSNTFDSSSSIWMASIGSLSKDASASRIATWQESGEGNYFYRACVRAVLGERNTNDNCTSAIEIEVEALSLNVVLNTTNDSGIIEVTSTITNSSNIAVNIALIEFYRNEAILTTSDQNTRLLPNQSFTFSTTDIPTEPGNYNYQVCMQDTSSNNFCSNERSFALFPELSISLRSNIEFINPSSDFNLTIEVANDGNRFSPPTHLDIFSSLSDTFDTSSNIFTTPIGDLSTDESVSVIRNQQEANEGIYFYRACVRAVLGERNINNNCADTTKIEVFAIPDISIDTIGVSSTDVEAGSTLSISTQISNIGLKDISPINIQFYRSSDITISTADILITSASVNTLSIGESIDVEVTAIGELGRFYYGTCVERVGLREDISNNCSHGISVNGNLLWEQATDDANWSARLYHTSLVYDNKMWVLGGHSGSFKNDVWYSTDGRNWIQATDDAGWSGREFHTSLVYDNKMWVLGEILLE